MPKDYDPIAAEPPREVPLPKAPLIRVIAQMKFPLIAMIERSDFVAPFQEAIRAKYPVLRHEPAPKIFVGAGSPPVQGPSAWRFSDIQGSWRASLAGDFLALETTQYKSRTDFFARFGELVKALDQHVGPKLVDRLGVRYIDKISGLAMQGIDKLVRPEVLGITGSPSSIHAEHTLAETKFTADKAFMTARWGCLPAGATPDPSAIEPMSDRSWILDLDMFSAAPSEFSVDTVVATATRFAERIYTVFRWAVTDEFLRHFGGKP
ncbi:MAG: TIGR04255 family protein [Planctomycetota bacterium]